MKTIEVKAVLLLDDKGNYFIHGSNGEEPDAMFKAMMPIWTFNPVNETAHFVTVNVTVPEFEKAEIETDSNTTDPS